jgi:hypothetical protein
LSCSIGDKIGAEGPSFDFLDAPAAFENAARGASTAHSQRDYHHVGYRLFSDGSVDTPYMFWERHVKQQKIYDIVLREQEAALRRQTAWPANEVKACPRYNKKKDPGLISGMDWS